jgi:hypothetical protein
MFSIFFRREKRQLALPSVRNSAPTGRILMKLGIWDCFRKPVKKIQALFKSDMNNG